MQQSSKLTNSEHTERRIACNFLFGGIAGSIAKTIIAPFDRAKIIFQTSHKKYSFNALFVVLRETHQKHGTASLWRGNTATVSRIFPYAAVQYSAHEKYKHMLNIDSPERSLELTRSSIQFRRFLAGAMAGLTSVAITYPFDFARARMAVTHKQKYENLIHVLSVVRKEEGLLQIYKGFTPTILGSMPYSGIAFFTFETLKEWRLNQLKKNNDNITRLDPISNLFCGAFAGIFGQTFTYPLDIVRRRMQTGYVTGHPEYCETIIKTLSLVIKREGFIGGLYKGLSLNWIKGPIASGISFTVFHQLQLHAGSLICS